MNAPALPGQHEIVRRKRMPWSIAITIAFAFALLVAIAHTSQFGPGIDHAPQVFDIGKYLCQGNQGLRRITLRAAPDTYTFKCRDGALHVDVQIKITEPQS